MKDVGVVEAMDGKSDHRAVSAELECRNRPRPRQQRKRAQVGWKPKLTLDGRPREYHKALDEVTAVFTSEGGDLTNLVAEAASHSREVPSRPRRQHSTEVQDLFRTRRDEVDPRLRKDLSKKLWKALRRQRRQKQADDIEALTNAGAGARRLQRTQVRHSGVERTHSIRGSDDEVKSDQASILEVFAKFYENLYEADADRRDCVEDDLVGLLLRVWPEEVDSALKELKTNGQARKMA